MPTNWNDRAQPSTPFTPRTPVTTSFTDRSTITTDFTDRGAPNPGGAISPGMIMYFALGHLVTYTDSFINDTTWSNRSQPASNWTDRAVI
jgi:hypothetical protein